MKKLLVIALLMLVTQLQAQVRIGDAEAYFFVVGRIGV